MRMNACMMLVNIWPTLNVLTLRALTSVSVSQPTSGRMTSAYLNSRTQVVINSRLNISLV